MRGNMRPMIVRVWQLDSQNKKQRGPDASWYAMYDRSLTFNGMQEAYNAMATYWQSRFDADTRERWANDFRIISPHSPQALRWAIQLVEAPTIEQLTQWESEAGEDPVVYSRLGDGFAKFERYDDAIRVYERSIDLSPSKNAYVGLANAHRECGPRGTLATDAGTILRSPITRLGACTSACHYCQ